jgi:hypothetical protein
VMALINNLWKNEWIQHNSWMIAKWNMQLCLLGVMQKMAQGFT